MGGQAALWKGMAADMTSAHVCGLDVSGVASASFLSLKTPNNLRVSGVIDAVGEEVEGWAVGDAVLYHGAPSHIRNTSMISRLHAAGSLYRSSGGFAEYAIQDCRYQSAACCMSRVTRHASPQDPAGAPSCLAR